MRWMILIIGLLTANSVFAQTREQSAYDFSFDAIDSGEVSLAAYRGKAIMVVNTASFCGFTNQYTDLQQLWDAYREQGLVVVGVPSGDFGNQEYAQDGDIKEFCEMNFGINFPLTAKTRVKGKKAHPFYKWAGKTLGRGNRPDWNFHKYLIDRQGRLVSAFDSHIDPNSKPVLEAVEAILADKQISQSPGFGATPRS